jgi:hypothetical protein
MVTRKPAQDGGREAVKAYLEAIGFHSEVIPEAETKTPDLSMPQDSGRILIELKAKVDDDHLRRILNSAPGSGHAYHNPSIQSRLREGRKQMTAFPDRTPQDFSLVWMLGSNTGLTALVRPAAIGLLYGVQMLDGFMEDTKQSFSTPCYFFGNSWFFNNRELDAVVLQDFQGIHLCLNPFSSRFADFKQTAFFEFFYDNHAVVDPAHAEAARECFIADCDIPRKDLNRLIEYLILKYRLVPPVNIVQPYFVNVPV